MTESRVDAVIIGGGHNGLVAGAYLARAGISTVVLEAAQSLGGQTTTLRPFPDAPNHCVNPCAVDDVFLSAGGVIDELGLRDFEYTDLVVDPGCVYLDPEGASLAFWRDPARTGEEIRAFSPIDATAYLDLMRSFDVLVRAAVPMMRVNPTRPGVRAIAQAAAALTRGARSVPSLASLVLMSAAEVIDERFRHPIVRNALAELACASVGPVTPPGSAVALMVPAFIHRFGIRRPKGGTQTLVDALVGALEAFGGKWVTGALVEEILVSGRRVVGVRLTSGETVRCQSVIATCDPSQALGRLLPPGSLDPATNARVAHIPTAALGVMPMKVDLALSGRLRLDRHQRQRRDGLDLRRPAALVGQFDGILRSCEAAGRGLVPDDIHFFSVTPTALDPSQAPPGQDTLYLYPPVMPLHPHSPWDLQATDTAKAVVAKAAEFYDGIEELEVDRFIETPDDLARRIHATPGAAVFHVDFSPWRMGPFRPALGLGGYRTPVEGLYLGGAGSHPGAGMTGLPGRLAAQELLRDARRATKRSLITKGFHGHS